MTSGEVIGPLSPASLWPCQDPLLCTSGPCLPSLLGASYPVCADWETQVPILPCESGGWALPQALLSGLHGLQQNTTPLNHPLMCEPGVVGGGRPRTGAECDRPWCKPFSPLNRWQSPKALDSRRICKLGTILIHRKFHRAAVRKKQSTPGPETVTRFSRGPLHQCSDLLFRGDRLLHSP